MTALLVAGALLSSVFAEWATGKPAPIQAAEECVSIFSDGGSSLFSGFDGDAPSSTGCLLPDSFTEQSPVSAISQAVKRQSLRATPQPLFLLFHAFLFYDRI